MLNSNVEGGSFAFPADCVGVTGTVDVDVGVLVTNGVFVIVGVSVGVSWIVFVGVAVGLGHSKGTQSSVEQIFFTISDSFIITTGVTSSYLKNW